MGLEGVETVIEVEETFGIVVSDQEAGSIRTVGQLCELVVSKLSSSEACASMVAFNRLRRTLQTTAGVARREVVPAASLKVLLPALHRHKAWQQLSGASQLRLPALRRSAWV